MNLEIIQNNEIIKELFNSLNSNELTKEDKFNLLKEILDWLSTKEKVINENEILKIKDYKELVKLLWENKNKLTEGIIKYVS
jgi:hypothetical protein